MTATLATATTDNPTTGAPMPKLWAKFSVRTGTLVQLAGLAAGLAGLVSAGHLHATAGLRVAVLALGWLAIYISSHAIAHVAVGRAVGVRFRAYGVRGTDHPRTTRLACAS